jgi:hypothetical protein
VTPEAPFQPGQPDQQAFHGYWLARIPDQRDPVLDDYVATLRAGGPPAVAAATDEATQAARAVLQCYGQRAAARAVRERRPDLLVSGLVAAVVGGLSRELEAYFPMALIDDAATRIGADLQEVFGAAATIVGNPGDVNLMLWLARPPQHRTPKSMGFTPVDGPDGFRYAWA